MPGIIPGMHNDEALLKDWEAVYRQGLLTFWTFLVLRDRNGDVSQIRRWIAETTEDTYTPAEQTLYRQLRRHLDVGLVALRKLSGAGGPPRNEFQLTESGSALLRRFADRNIRLFDQPAVRRLLSAESA